MSNPKKTNEELLQELQEIKQAFELLKANTSIANNHDADIFKLAFENSPIGKSLTSIDGTLKVNNAFCKMVGYTKEEMDKLNFNAITHPDDVEMSNDKLKKQLVGNGQSECFQKRYIHKKGNIVWAELHTFLHRDSAGKHLYFLTEILEVTERKQAEEALQIAKEHAEKCDHLKTAFLQNMSHEIRTPMNAIMGFSDLLANHFNDKQKLERDSRIISQRCSDLLSIINDILDIAKIDSGQLTLNIEACNLKLLLHDLDLFFNAYKKRIGKDHLAFSIEYISMSSDLTIKTDVVKLKQIFINLLTNAFKFTKQGSIHAGYSIDSQGNFEFFVSDTGIGIHPDQQELIFERFTQVTGDGKYVYGGTGLGLSIVKGLVILLGGAVNLKSEYGKGSTFSFSLPNNYEDVKSLKDGPGL